jgi:hypothetical protein
MKQLTLGPRWTRMAGVFVTLGIGTAASLQSASSEWVHPGPDGRLIYRELPKGDRIMDFSHAGYRGGGIALPEVPVAQTVQPSGGDDDSPSIQAAIDAVGLRPLVNGFRGAVLLAPGTFQCAKPLVIAESGVVLRGSGSNPDGVNTTVAMRGPQHIAFVVGRRTSRLPLELSAEKTTLADSYVPSGATSFTVRDATQFAVGDRIALVRPASAAWVRFMHMDDLVRAGTPQVWFRPDEASGVTVRTIVGISDREVTCDLPLCDSYDAAYLDPPGTTVAKVASKPTLTDIGIEHLRLRCPPLAVAFNRAPYSGFRMLADDCWLKDVSCEEIMNATMLVGNRITLQRVVVKHTFPNRGAAKPADFGIQGGSQILIDRCEVTGDNEYFVWTTGREGGPNVVLNSTFRGRISRIQPHARWSTGLLVDNCTTPDDGIDFMNRGVAGDGFGWGMGWGVAWNCVAHNTLIQNPPGAANWSIGCIGDRMQLPRMFAAGPILPEGIVESPGVPVAPQSLYLAQLEERLGQKAVQALGYAANTAGEFSGKTTPPLPPYPPDIDPVLGSNLALHQAVDTSSVRGDAAEFGGEQALDAEDKTVWASKDGDQPAWLELDLEGPVALNALLLEEAPGPGHRVKSFKVEGMVDSDWQLLAQGTAMEERYVARFSPVKVWKVRLTVIEADGYVALRKLGLYMAPPPSSTGD